MLATLAPRKTQTQSPHHTTVNGQHEPKWLRSAVAQSESQISEMLVKPIYLLTCLTLAKKELKKFLKK